MSTDVAPLEQLPELIQRASSALLGAKDSAELLEARDMARVAYDAAKTAGRLAKARQAHDDIMRAVYRAQADAALIEVRAKVRLADAYDLAQAEGDVPKAGRPPAKILPDQNNLRGQDIGISHKDIFETRQLRNAEMIAPGIIEDTHNNQLYRGDPPTKAAVQYAVDVVLGKRPRGTFGSGDNEWYTPEIYLQSAHHVMDDIDLDPASSDAAQNRVRAKAYYTRDDSALTKPWFGRVWLNPPYAREWISLFAHKLVSEVLSGNVVAAIMLVNNYTETAWFHHAESHAALLCFTRGRLQFESPTREGGSPIQGSVFFYFGDDQTRFRDEFSQYGFVR